VHIGNAIARDVLKFDEDSEEWDIERRENGLATGRPPNMSIFEAIITLSGLLDCLVIEAALIAGYRIHFAGRTFALDCTNCVRIPKNGSRHLHDGACSGVPPLAKWKAPAPLFKFGVFAKYAAS
jgi:hypothetical protein